MAATEKQQFSDADLGVAAETTKERVAAGVLDAHKANDLTVVDDDGDEYADDVKFNERAFKILLELGSRPRRKKPEKGLTKSGYTAKMFPATPGRDGWHELVVHRAAGLGGALERKTWNAASQTGVAPQVAGLKDNTLVIHAKAAIEGAMAPIAYLTSEAELDTRRMTLRRSSQG